VVLQTLRSMGKQRTTNTTAITNAITDSGAVFAGEESRAHAKAKARSLYWQGWRITYIAEHLGIPRTTLHDWREAEGWDEAKPLDRVQGTLECRLVQLISKEEKTGGDFKEIDLLGRQLERTARVERYKSTGKEGDLNPAVHNRNAGPKNQPVRNFFSSEDIAKLEEAFTDALFGYQKVWLRNGTKRTRFLLKSRQIGATWYFSREALLDAIKTGKNKIFLSASKAQAHVFKSYIKSFAMEVCGIDLQGDPIKLWNGAELIFLGTNARTAQSYHGDFFFDECFWVPKFEEINKVASGMAMHKHWRKTYFSTPSSIQHQAYALWSGARYNRNRQKDQRISLDLSHEKLKGGFEGEDHIWRMITTLLDAEAAGCDLFDVEELRTEYSPDEFDNLLMCQFVDDTKSVFQMTMLQKCMVDSWVEWTDYKTFIERPFGDRPVWVGYDPNKGTLNGDGAACVVIAPPDKPSVKYRLLEKHQWKGLDYEKQAEAIRQITLRYNVQYIGIDSTGIGGAVHTCVKRFYPQAVAYDYSLASKTALVLKAFSVVSKGRFEFDAGATDVAAHFLAIRRVLTASGRNTTFEAGRSESTGHADLAWACMHCFIHEGLDGVDGLGANSTNILEMT